MLLEIIKKNRKSRKADIFDAKVCKDNVDYQFQKKHGFRFVLPFSETKEIILDGKIIYKEENNG